jgi:hypothetical protein
MKKNPPTEGIYFVVRLPAGWRLLTYRFDQGPDEGHAEYWERDVVPMLIEAWWPKLSAAASAAGRPISERWLKSELEMHYDGFPRGRVTLSDEGKPYYVLHGANLEDGMKVTRRAIETAFGVTGKVTWVFDEHEQCGDISAEGLRSVLQLKDTWKSVSPSFD